MLRFARAGAKIRIGQVHAEIERLESILAQLDSSRRVVGADARAKGGAAGRARRRQPKAAKETEAAPQVAVVTKTRRGPSSDVRARIAESRRVRHAGHRQERETAPVPEETRQAEAAAEAARRRMLPRHVPRAQRLQVSPLSTPAGHPTDRRGDEPPVVANAPGGWLQDQGSMVTRWQRVDQPADTHGGRDVATDDVARLLEAFRSL
jgi:hypothetical protein